MVVVDDNDGRGEDEESLSVDEWGGRRLLGPVVSKRLPLIPEQNNKTIRKPGPDGFKIRITPCMK